MVEISNGSCRIGRVRFKSGGEMRVLETRPQGDPEVLEMLIDYLDRARRGELVALAVVSVSPDGIVATGWGGGGGGYYHEIVSGAATLLHRMGSD
jgi:hypothetical protein